MWTVSPLTPPRPFGLVLSYDAPFPSARIAAVQSAEFRDAFRGAFNQSDGLVVIRGLHGLPARVLTEALGALGTLEASPADGGYESIHPENPLLHEFSKVPSARVFDEAAMAQGERAAEAAEAADVTYNATTGRPSWHTDQSFRTPAIMGSAMFCLATPGNGVGATLYAGTVAAYADLDAPTRERIEGLDGVHSYAALAANFERFTRRSSGLSAQRLASLNGVRQPLVMRHPSHRPSLYLAPHAMAGVPGLPEEEGEALITRLVRHATQPRYVYRHVWRTGDLVVWDNRLTMHAATHLDAQQVEERVMWRATFTERTTGDAGLASTGAPVALPGQGADGMAEQGAPAALSAACPATAAAATPATESAALPSLAKSRMVRVRLEALESSARQRLEAAGAGPDTARAVAAQLARAEASGKRSHGLRRLSGMLEALEQKHVVGDARQSVRPCSPRTDDDGDGDGDGDGRAAAPGTVVAEAAACLLLDGGGGFAQPGLAMAVPPLLRSARAHGVAALRVTNTSGISGSLGISLLENGCGADGIACLLVANTPAYMAAGAASAARAADDGDGDGTGHRAAPKRLLGTNPLAFVWPRGPAEAPLVIDMAMAATSRGEIESAAASGRLLPEGVALDAHGMPTRNASAALAGAQLAFGGYKGACLALMVELLAGALTGSALAPEAQHWDAMNRGMLVLALALPPPATADPEATSSSIDPWANRLLQQLDHVPGAAAAAAHATAVATGSLLVAAGEAKRLGLEYDIK